MNIQIPGIQAALTEETDRRHPERTEGIFEGFWKISGGSGHHAAHE